MVTDKAGDTLHNCLPDFTHNSQSGLVCTSQHEVDATELQSQQIKHEFEFFLSHLWMMCRFTGYQPDCTNMLPAANEKEEVGHRNSFRSLLHNLTPFLLKDLMDD